MVHGMKKAADKGGQLPALVTGECHGNDQAQLLQIECWLRILTKLLPYWRGSDVTEQKGLLL